MKNLSRGQRILLLIFAAIPVIFLLVMLTLYTNVIFTLLVILGMVLVVGLMYRNNPNLFDGLRKKPEKDDTDVGLKDRPVDPLAHVTQDKVYMELRSTSGNGHITVNKSTFIIGRSAGCDAQVTVGMVSKQHLKLEFNNGHCYATDLGSTNGTRINGNPLTPNSPYPLCQDDWLQIADNAYTVELANY